MRPTGNWIRTVYGKEDHRVERLGLSLLERVVVGSNPSISIIHYGDVAQR